MATDAWFIPSQYLRPGMKPRAVVVDLRGLPQPQGVLAELRVMIGPDHVLVVTALGTITSEEIRNLGFHVVARRASVGAIVSAAADLLRRDTAQ